MAARDPDLMLPGPLRRALHLVWRVTRGMTLGVRGVVRDEEGRFLLVRHTYTPGWHFPGGGVEPGETPADALARELHEEAGITLRAPLVLHGVFFNAAVSNRDHVIVYVVGVHARDDTLRDAREIAEVRFVDPRELPDDTTPGTRRRIAEIVGDTAVGERW